MPLRLQHVDPDDRQEPSGDVTCHRPAGAGIPRYIGDRDLVYVGGLRGLCFNRAARFVCAIALVEGGRVAGVYYGAVDGLIIDEARGTAGFGYDPLFFCPAFGCTFGEATAEQKFSLSHRGQALRAMLADPRIQ